jgi:hypothetical protein
MSSDKNSIVEKSIGTAADAAKSVADGAMGLIGSFIGVDKSSSKETITVTDSKGNTTTYQKK